MAPSAQERQFLDPMVVARLGTLELKARTVVEGFLSGLHRSPFKGFSVEFAEYRQYIPGDDLSTIDWKVYARSDRHYVKKFEEETNLDCHVMLDISASMGYGSGGMTKHQYSQCLAASLGYLMNRQRDRVGLTAFDDRAVETLPASARPGHLRALLLTLDRLRLGRKTNVSKPLHQLADSLSKRGMVILISDLLDEPESVIQGLKHFQFRGTDVIVFHVLDPDERTFPFELSTTVRGSRNERRHHGGAGRGARALPRGDRRTDRTVQARARRVRDRLPPADDRPATRAGVAGLSFDAREEAVIAFLSPLFLAGALAAAVPILLHLLKREPETRLQFSAVKLLRGAPVEHSRKQYLRDLLLLALRVTALLLLALAFARPFFRSDAYGATSGITVVAIDTSLSMSAGRQFERAKQLAREAVDRAPAGDLVGIVTFADRAAVALQPAADRTMARSAIEAATTGFGATSYRAALAAAADMASAHGGDRSTIVVVTDLQESGWDAGDRITVPESARIEVADVGASPPNLAVTAIRASRDRVVATIRNAGPRAREARVELNVDGRLAGEAGAAIGPNQTADVTLPGARGGSAVVSVSDADGVLADNARYVVLEDTGRPSVLVVTASGDVSREAFYVQHALTAPGPERPGLSSCWRGRWPAGHMGSGAAGAACRHPAAVDARSRAARPGTAGRVPAEGRWSADGCRSQG